MLIVIVWLTLLISIDAEFHSSISCYGQDHLSRICEIQNLCYRPALRKFIFYIGVGSRRYGVPKNPFAPTLCEVSGVANHSFGHFNYVEIPSSEENEGYRRVLPSTSVYLLLKRFLPNNLMHIFHDDLLPIYHTTQIIQRLVGIQTEVQTVCIDDYDSGPFWHLYSRGNMAVFLKDFETEATNEICFPIAFVGLSRVSNWYQYGFFQPQGPIANPMVNKELLQDFREHFVASIGLTLREASDNQNNCVLLSRKGTRLILNEEELISALIATLLCKVAVVSLETHSVQEIIQALM